MAKVLYLHDYDFKSAISLNRFQCAICYRKWRHSILNLVNAYTTSIMQMFTFKEISKLNVQFNIL